MEITDVLTPFVSAPTFTVAVARFVILLLSAIMALVAWTAYTNPARSARSMSKTTSSNRPYMLLFAGRELGFAVQVAADGVCSRRDDSRDAGLDLATRCGAPIPVAETVVLDWLRDSASPHFRAISRLIR